MNLIKPITAGFLPALALCGMLFCTAMISSAQDAVPEPKDDAAATSTVDKPAEVDPATIDERPSMNETAYAVDNMILFVCAVLVIFMQAGFALVETGLNASKNAVNIMFKNYMDFVLGALLFFLIGYGLMYPGGDEKAHIIPNWLGFAQVGVPEDPESLPEIGQGKAHPLDPMADFLFQVAFAATAATIVSGSVAGRIKFTSYLIYTAVITAFIYPVSGMWHWGKGWLMDMGFIDFAGSLVVHSVGGFAGLAGAIALGPRLGRFVNGKPQAMPGHNIPYAALGVFILMIGWYGFNPGSQLAFTGVSNTKLVMKIAVCTTLAGCAGSVSAMICSWLLYKKPDLTFALNGGLAGLVSITANCHVVTTWEALAIGFIGGIVVVGGIILLDKLQIDDPVGAFPVHGLCGVWAGIATGLFGEGAVLTTQIIGSLAIPAWALSSSLVLFFGLKAVGMLRVSAEEEIAGLDICEHGMYAYPQNVVALDTVNSSFGSGQMKLTSPAVAAKPSTEAV